jgi:glycosyltransferase involved in cell wall biosynthesis
MTTPIATIALPTWNSGSIIWLQLESLCSQVTDYPFEVIVMEDLQDSKDVAGDGVLEYCDRIKEAGGDLRYLQVENRMLLGEKWKAIAEEAKGEYFILAASDNYSAPDRIQRTVRALEKGADWYDVRTGAFYNIKTGEEGTYKDLDTENTGLFMATRTDYIRGLQGTPPKRGVDTWIKSQINVRQKAFDIWHDGIHTDGYNTISHHRAKYYSEQRGSNSGRFQRGAARGGVERILPADVLERLKGMQNQ